MSIFDKDNNYIEITKEDISNAANICAEVKSSNAKRVFANVLGAELGSKFLHDLGVNTNNNSSLHTIPAILKDLDIADIQTENNIKIDVRIVQDEDHIFIPKSHYDYEITPDIYIIIQIAEDSSGAKFIGAIAPDEIDKSAESNGYYKINSSTLYNDNSLKSVLNTNKAQNNEPINDSDITKAESLFVSYIDDELADKDKHFLYKILSKNNEILAQFREFQQFETVSSALANTDEVLNDSVLDVLGAERLYKQDILNGERNNEIDLDELAELTAADFVEGLINKNKDSNMADNENIIEGEFNELPEDSELQEPGELEDLPSDEELVNLSSFDLQDNIENGNNNQNIDLTLPELEPEADLSFKFIEESTKRAAKNNEAFHNEAGSPRVDRKSSLFDGFEGELTTIEDANKDPIQAYMEEEEKRLNKIEDIDLKEIEAAHPELYTHKAYSTAINRYEMSIANSPEMVRYQANMEKQEQEREQEKAQQNNDNNSDVSHENEEDFSGLEEFTMDMAAAVEEANPNLLNPKIPTNQQNVSYDFDSSAQTFEDKNDSDNTEQQDNSDLIISDDTEKLDLDSFNLDDLDNEIDNESQEVSQENNQETDENLDVEIDNLLNESDIDLSDIDIDNIDASDINIEDLDNLPEISPDKEDENVTTDESTVESESDGLNIENDTETPESDVELPLDNNDEDSDSEAFSESMEDNSNDMTDSELITDAVPENAENTPLESENIEENSQELSIVQEESSENSELNLYDDSINPELNTQEGMPLSTLDNIPDISNENYDINQEQSPFNTEIDEQYVPDYSQNDENTIEQLYDENNFNQNPDGTMDMNFDQNNLGVETLSKAPTKKKSVVPLLLVAVVLAAGAVGFVKKDFIMDKFNAKNTPDNEMPQNANMPVEGDNKISENKSGMLDQTPEDNQNEKQTIGDIPGESGGPQDAKSMEDSLAQNNSANTYTPKIIHNKEIKKLYWEVPQDLTYNSLIVEYLKTVGKTARFAIESDLLNTTEYPYSNQLVVNAIIKNDGTVDNVEVSHSCGSKQIDELVLQSVKAALKYVKAPTTEFTRENYEFSFIINF